MEHLSVSGFTKSAAADACLSHLVSCRLRRNQCAKRLRLPFLHQLLLTYLVALLLPVALIGQQTWVGYQRTLENEIRQTNSQLLTEIASVINMQLQGLEQIAVNLDLNEDLRPFAVTSTPFGAVQALQTLSQYRSSNSFIYEVGYYIRGNPYLYTSTAAYPLSQFLYHFFAQDGLDDSKLQDLLETCRAPVILPAAPTRFVSAISAVTLLRCGCRRTLCDGCFLC